MRLPLCVLCSSARLRPRRSAVEYRAASAAEVVSAIARPPRERRKSTAWFGWRKVREDAERPTPRIAKPREHTAASPRRSIKDGSRSKFTASATAAAPDCVRASSLWPYPRNFSENSAQSRRCRSRRLRPLITSVTSVASVASFSTGLQLGQLGTVVRTFLASATSFIIGHVH